MSFTPAKASAPVFSRPMTQRVRRFGLLAGALAFLCQVMAWTLMMPAASAQAGLVPICTAEGLILAAVDGNGAKKPDSGSVSAMACPLCPLVAGMAPPPAPPAEPLPAGIGRHTPVALPGAFVASGWFLSSVQARAPPAA